jgi:VCBS repeat-containing protein
VSNMSTKSAKSTKIKTSSKSDKASKDKELDKKGPDKHVDKIDKHDEKIIGTSKNEMFDGGSGNDFIHGGGGKDFILGGSGNDILDGGSGSDIVGGGSGNDTLNYVLSDNVKSGAKTIDMYDGGSGTDTINFHMTKAEYLAYKDALISFYRNWSEGGSKSSNGATFSINGGTTVLCISNMEKLVFYVDGVATDILGVPPVVSNSPVVISSGAQAGGVTEDAASLTATGAISFQDLNSSDIHTASVTSGPASALGVLTLVTTQQAGGAGGSTAWTYTLDNALADSLGAGQTVTEVYTITIDDGHGATTTQQITITIRGANDAATLSADTRVLAETDAVLSTGGTFAISDVDNAASFVAQAATDGLYGTFTVDAAGAWTYVADSAFDGLNVGQSYSETFSVFAVDGTQTSVQVTIDGTNDAAVLSADARVLAETGTALSTGGTLTITDVDNAASFVAQAATDGIYGTFTIDVAGAWTYVANSAFDGLNVGQSHSETFSVFSVDGTQTSVQVTIDGTNDAAVVSGATSGIISEVAAPNTINGDLDATDADGPGDSFVPVMIGIATTYGSYTVDATGHWVYTLDNSNAQVQLLNTGQTLPDSFTVATTDGATQLVTVAIQGLSNTITIAAAYTGGGDVHDFDTASNVATGMVATINADTLIGTTGDDGVISLLAGNDTYYGGDGDDGLINGNDGVDRIYGQAGNDSIDGNLGNDVLYGGSGNDILNGNDGLEIIYGGSGADTISGGANRDIIYGGYGADIISGGADIDTFFYTSVLDTGDTISDFSGAGVLGGDILSLSGIDANSTLAGNNAFAFGGTTATANGVWYSTSGGNAVLYADTDGDLLTIEFAITLNAVTSFTATDFVL